MFKYNAFEFKNIQTRSCLHYCLSGLHQHNSAELKPHAGQLSLPISPPVQTYSVRCWKQECVCGRKIRCSSMRTRDQLLSSSGRMLLLIDYNHTPGFPHWCCSELTIGQCYARNSHQCSLVLSYQPDEANITIPFYRGGEQGSQVWEWSTSLGRPSAPGCSLCVWHSGPLLLRERIAVVKGADGR